MGWPYREVSELSERQQGQLSHEQLESLGLSDKAIVHSLAAGRITETFARVYAIGDRALPPLWREMGAALACGEEAFISRHWAVAAWGVRPLPVGGDGGGGSAGGGNGNGGGGGGGGDLKRDVDVTVPYGRNARRAGIRIHRCRRIDPRDVTELHGVPISTPAFALLEIAPELSLDEFERAFDDGLTSGVMTLAAAQQTLARHRNRRGARRFALLAHPEHELQITRSQAEQLMKRLVRTSGLTPTRWNRRRGRIFPDLIYESEKVIVEIDGYRTHGTRRAFESDRARDAQLAAQGCIVLRFTWRQLTNEPELVIVRLAQTLAVRRAA